MNNEKTWYPSDCVLEEWDQGRDKINGGKDTSEQGRYRLQQISNYQ